MIKEHDLYEDKNKFQKYVMNSKRKCEEREINMIVSIQFI